MPSSARLARFGVVALFCVGCGACSTAKDPASALVRIHATKDLNCPDDQVRVESLWGGRYRASGCGRRTTYQSNCRGLNCAVGEQGSDPSPSLGRPDPGDPFGDR